MSDNLPEPVIPEDDSVVQDVESDDFEFPADPDEGEVDQTPEVDDEVAEEDEFVDGNPDEG